MALALNTLKVWNKEWSKDHTDILHLAALNGLTQICRILVEEKDFPVDVYDTSGKPNHEETVIHLAAKNGHVEVIKYFYERCNSDLNATFSKVLTLLFINFRFLLKSKFSFSDDLFFYCAVIKWHLTKI